MLFFYKNTHWYEKDSKKIEKAGTIEKKVTLPNGNVINYGETGEDESTLLLIHGQMGAWEAYYLRNCYWGKLFMPNAMNGIANYAQMYREKHPNEEVKIAFLPKSITGIFHFVVDYDFKYGEHFYDLSWNNGIKQEDIFVRHQGNRQRGQCVI